MATRFSALTSVGPLRVSLSRNRDFTLVTLHENFQLEWAVLDWLAIEGQLIGSTAGATDLRGSIRVGLSYAYGGEVMLVARVLEKGPFYLSGMLAGDALAWETIVPAQLLDAIEIEDGMVNIQRPSIMQSGRLYRLRPGVMPAVGALRWTGFQLGALVDVDFLDFDRGGSEVTRPRSRSRGECRSISACSGWASPSWQARGCCTTSGMSTSSSRRCSQAA